MTKRSLFSRNRISFSCCISLILPGIRLPRLWGRGADYIRSFSGDVFSLCLSTRRRGDYYNEVAGLLTWFVTDCLPVIFKLLTVAWRSVTWVVSGESWVIVTESKQILRVFLFTFHDSRLTIHVPHSYGDSSGFTPDSLLIPRQKAEKPFITLQCY